jgi:pseudouridylate synthase
MNHALCAATPEVAAALASRRPVVALESTIITHGMPYPQNVETARAVEAVVRATGAVPATIAVIAGRIRVGLADADMDWLGQARGVLKLSRADLAHAVASGLPGSTSHHDLCSPGRHCGVRHGRHRWRSSRCRDHV